MKARDGRNTRWDSHRRNRRAELVDAALVAIRRHGPSVGMDEVAAVAGTSKTVLYRHFADKAGLYLAVCTRVTETLLAQLAEVLRPDVPPREALVAAIDVYLQLIESDPNVYRFVVGHPDMDRPVDTDPVAGLIGLIGDRVARVLERPLTEAGQPPSLALAWGHGLAGMIQAGADPWLRGRVSLSRAELTTHLTDLVWPGLAGLLVLDSSLEAG